MIFNLISLVANTALQLPVVQGLTKGNYSQLAGALESAIAPLIGMIPGWLKGGSAAPSATMDVLAAYATALGVLNALKKQPGLPPLLMARLDEYANAGQDGITQWMAASKGFDPGNFLPVAPMPVVPATASKVA